MRAYLLVLLAVSTIVLSFPKRVEAADPVPADTVTESVSKYSAIPRSLRPPVIVMPFEFQAQLSDEDRAELNSLTAALIAIKGGDPNARLNQSLSNLGKSAASLLVEGLLQTSQFRVLERAALDQVLDEQNLVSGSRAGADQTVAQKAKLLGAKYMVTGAITKFGRERREKGGALGVLAKRAPGIGALGIAENTYTVGITIRVVETATGEIVSSLSSDGEVKGGRKLVFGGGGGAGAGVFGSSSSGEKEKKVAESIALAVERLVEDMVRARERGDLEP